LNKTNQQFKRYIGIDYSGAQTPTSSLKGLRVYLAEVDALPIEVLPPPSRLKYWTRRGIAEWLVARLAEDIPTLIGIDHSFSFPLRYFERHHLAPDWVLFLNDFQAHWPTDQDNVSVDFIRKGLHGTGLERSGSPRWRRLTEEKSKAKSVFHFDVQGQVAKSTHAGLPWLRFIRNHVSSTVHFWPFSGWDIPSGYSAVLEAYPALYKKNFDSEDRTPDQHDAYAIVAWLQKTDRNGDLVNFLNPPLTQSERDIAIIEGWILGVM